MTTGMNEYSVSSERKLRVFLSHSSLDKPFVRLLATDLIGFGADIWLDELELNVADSLLMKISDAIQSSAFIAACLSPHSIKSIWVTKELSMGAEISANSANSLTILPLLLDGLSDTQIPPFLLDQLYADFRGVEKYDKAFSNIMRYIKPGFAAIDRVDILSNFEATPLPIDDTRVYRLIRLASTPKMREWITSYLSHSVTTHQDATDRYWIYIGLGHLGGETAIATIRKGLSDDSSWARKGAQKASELLSL